MSLIRCLWLAHGATVLREFHYDENWTVEGRGVNKERNDVRARAPDRQRERPAARPTDPILVVNYARHTWAVDRSGAGGGGGRAARLLAIIAEEHAAFGPSKGRRVKCPRSERLIWAKLPQYTHLITQTTGLTVRSGTIFCRLSIHCSEVCPILVEYLQIWQNWLRM